MTQSVFWNLRKAESTSRRAEWAHDEMGPESWGETRICPIEGPLGGGRRVKDLSITLPGNTLEDIVWTWDSECLLTDRVLDLFRSSGLTGFEIKPVKAVFKRAREKPPRLRELVVTGWGGVAPPESGIKLAWQCPACGRRKYSDCVNPDKLIDASQWDGSDLFMVWPLPAFIFVTDRVAQVIRDNSLTGAVLKRLGDLDFGTGGFSPARLSYRMSEERAKELGGPFGID